MNKKVMAIAMATVMLMVAVTVGVSAQSDASVYWPDPGYTPVGPVGTEGNPKFIIGDSSEPVVSYGNEITGKIEFNRTAFTGGASVTITHNVSVSSLREGTETIGSNVATVSTDPEIVSGHEVPGKYTVTVTPQGDTRDYSLRVMICVTIKESPICGKTEGDGHTHGNSCYLPEQKYYYAINVKILASGASLVLNQGESPITIKEFGFQEDVNITASVMKNSSLETEDAPYLYYATGLPNGISMRMDGTIGGKIDSSLETTPTSETAYIYAVSNSGKVISTTLTWTIGQKSVPYYFELNVDGSTADISDGYITAEKGSPHSLTVKLESDYIVLGESLVVTGADGNVISPDNSVSSPNYGKYDIIGSNAGTGKFTVTVSADVKKTGADDSSAVHVVKSFNVYVIGNIVDADLDPSVTSR